MTSDASPGSSSGTPASPRRALDEALRATLLAIDLGALTARALAPRLPSLLAPGGRVRVIAAGKAAPAMARGALVRWADAIEAVLVVAPDGVACTLDDRRVRVLRAAHPIPDARGVVAAQEALTFVRAPRVGLVLALLSGGASALLCAPRGFGLDEKRAMVRALLHSGADISAINVVRRHASWIKGGALACAAAPARVISLLVSDVLGGAPHDIASGPTVCDPTTVADARAVLARYAPEFSHVPLHETLKPSAPAASRLHARTILGPAVLARALADDLARRGFAVTLLPPSGADVDTLARDYASRASSLPAGAALVRAAEPTVVVDHPAPGRGGRSSHLAALVAPSLPDGVAFLAGASDGCDGASDAAGAAVDGASFSRISASRIADHVARFATADLHAIAGTSITLGPTGLNLADVHALARSRR